MNDSHPPCYAHSINMVRYAVVGAMRLTFDSVTRSTVRNTSMNPKYFIRM